MNLNMISVVDLTKVIETDSSHISLLAFDRLKAGKRKLIHTSLRGYILAKISYTSSPVTCIPLFLEKFKNTF